MVNAIHKVKRSVFIDADPELVFTYLTDFYSHGEWDEYSGFAIVAISDGPVVEGSFCKRERIETFQSPILRGGSTFDHVIWTKSLTVLRFHPNHSLDFETKNLYNGLSIGSEIVSFRLLSLGSGTVLAMTDKKNPHLPGPFYGLMMAIEVLKSLIAQPVIGILFRLVPALRVNSQLRRIKSAMEKV